MPKGILEFNLPEEREEFESAQNDWKYRHFVDDFGEWLRRKYEHSDMSEGHTAGKEYDEILEKFLGMLTQGDL